MRTHSSCRARTVGAAVCLTALLGAGLAPEASAATVRVEGADRYATSAEISKAFVKTGGTVYVASGQGFADALAAGAAAGHAQAPVLLVRQNAVPEVIEARIKALAPHRIVVLGGPAAVSSGVIETLRPLSTEVQVIDGDNRYATAAELSKAEHPEGAATVYLASGVNYPDALAGGAAAATSDSPILLTRPDALPEETLAELKRLAPKKIVVLGGTSAISSDVFDAARGVAPVDRIAGADRYATAVALSAKSVTKADTVVLASGENFPDALSGAPRAALASAPVLLVAPGKEKTAPVCAEIERLGATNLVVLGGLSALSADMVKYLEDGCPGPGEYVFRGQGSQEVPLPELGASIVTITHTGAEVLDVYTEDANGALISVLVSQAASYTGTHTFNLASQPPASTMIVESKGASSGGGNWSLDIKPLSAAPLWDLTGSQTGTGDSVLRFPADRTDDVTLSVAGANGADVRVVLNDAQGGAVQSYGGSTLTVILPPEAVIAQISTNGGWTFAKK